MQTFKVKNFITKWKHFKFQSCTNQNRWSVICDTSTKTVQSGFFFRFWPVKPNIKLNNKGQRSKETLTQQTTPPPGGGLTLVCCPFCCNIIDPIQLSGVHHPIPGTRWCHSQMSWPLMFVVLWCRQKKKPRHHSRGSGKNRKSVRWLNDQNQSLKWFLKRVLKPNPISQSFMYSALQGTVLFWCVCVRVRLSPLFTTRVPRRTSHLHIFVLEVQK